MRVRLPLLVVIAAVAVAACGDDDVASGGASGTTASSSAETEPSSGNTPTADGTDADSNGPSGSGATTDASDETARVCTPVEMEPVTGEAFSGERGCAADAVNRVLDDPIAVIQHNIAYCMRLMECTEPDPECPVAPDVDLEGARIVYVYASRSGCSTEVRITEVHDCGDETEVHYLVNSEGPCTAFYDGWDAVVIPDGSPVTFIGHE